MSLLITWNSFNTFVIYRTVVDYGEGSWTWTQPAHCQNEAGSQNDWSFHLLKHASEHFYGWKRNDFKTYELLRNTVTSTSLLSKMTCSMRNFLSALYKLASFTWWRFDLVKKHGFIFIGKPDISCRSIGQTWIVQTFLRNPLCDRCISVRAKSC